MSNVSWRSQLSRALHRNRSLPNSRYFQLATVKKDGCPTNRTVVFRGFFQETNQLQIVTDSRSEKITEIQHQPWGEICWYFPKTREQFRLTGQLTLVDKRHLTLQDARQRAWQNLSEAGKKQFLWPHPKKERCLNKEAFAPEAVDDNQPVDNFCLLLFEPSLVDILQLKGEPQNRYLYSLQADGDWLKKEVNP